MATELLTFRETLEALRIGRNTLFKLIKSRALPHVRIGKKIFFKRTDLDRFIEKQTVKSDPA